MANQAATLAKASMSQAADLHEAVQRPWIEIKAGTLVSHDNRLALTSHLSNHGNSPAKVRSWTISEVSPAGQKLLQPTSYQVTVFPSQTIARNFDFGPAVDYAVKSVEVNVSYTDGVRAGNSRVVLRYLPHQGKIEEVEQSYS